MVTLRFSALQKVQERERVLPDMPDQKVSEYFGDDTFGMNEMKETLAPDVYKKVEHAIEKGKKIDMETADSIAASLKAWAMQKGITHYTHWFQPLTGTTAEKHDAFFDPLANIEKFKGSALVQQEPDASSFPSGGMRTTFEARGYTAWDPSSPIFKLGSTLCIPTIFISYTGGALDYKTPLLKAIETVDKAATKVVKYFDRSVQHVTPYLGCEQEYFVVDKALHDARPDLVMVGRTLFGHQPPRGQQLDDHYFGSIPERIYDFMRDFEVECWKLGIPVSTRHNEVAPSQFEVAPQFEELNIAADHNQLMMDVMKRVANRHDLRVLFHEKPFAGLNGSGKHNNWSLVTNTGVNLYQPSGSARENLLFLTFFVNTLKALHEHEFLMRASIASAGNDHRLGANEAPPAIMSAFIGDQLTAVLDELESNGNIDVQKGDNMYVKLGISKIPEIIQDNTDRNRTSPFAYTGNKFEFRAVGSDSNVSNPMTALNMIVADQLTEFAKEVDQEIAKGTEKRMAIVNILRKYIKESKNIRFEGDGYSDEWVQEAEKRGLSNVKDSARAMDAYLQDKTINLFEKHGVLTKEEIEARVNTWLENYILKVQIESRMMGDIALNHIISTATEYQGKLINVAKGLKDLGVENKAYITTINQISEYIENIKQYVHDMTEERKKANKVEDPRQRATMYCDNVKEAYFDKIRYSVDKLELLIDDDDWPLMKYRELLFIR